MCNRFCRFPFRIKTAVKHDKTKGYRTKSFRQTIVLKWDLEKSIAAKHHTDQHEKKQRRHPELARKLLCQYTQNNYRCH